MNQRIIFPNNPLFFLQFIIFPLIIYFICHQVGWTLDWIVEKLGAVRIAIIVFSYFIFVIGMVLSSLLVITDEYIRGPGNITNLFPVRLPLVDSECFLENRRTGKISCECLIIRNKYQPGEICLPCLYFSYELFDQIVNLVRRINEQAK